MKAAIVGCGQIAGVHIQAVRRLPGIEVAAVCDTNMHRAEQVAARFAVPQRFTNVEDMLERVRPDVVHITSPPATHLSVGRRVLQHGAHAYVEKPFTTSLGEADELIAIADQGKRLLCVGHSFLYDPAYLRLMEVVRAGGLGEIVHVEVWMSHDPANPYGAEMLDDPTHWVHRLPGGITQNIIPHPIYLVLNILDVETPAVIAKGFRMRHERYGDVRDRFQDELRVMILGKECTASLMLSCRACPEQLRLVLQGTRAQAEANLYARTVHYTERPSVLTPISKVRWAYEDMHSAVGELSRQLRRFAAGQLDYFDGLRELVRRFYLAVEGRGGMPVCVEDVRRVTAIIDDIFRQSKTDS